MARNSFDQELIEKMTATLHGMITDDCTMEIYIDGSEKALATSGISSTLYAGGITIKPENKEGFELDKTGHLRCRVVAPDGDVLDAVECGFFHAGERVAFNSFHIQIGNEDRRAR